MATSHKWQITRVDTRDEVDGTEVIVALHWECVSHVEDAVVRQAGIEIIERADGTTFRPISTLNRQTLLKWCLRAIAKRWARDMVESEEGRIRRGREPVSQPGLAEVQARIENDAVEIAAQRLQSAQGGALEKLAS